MADDNKDDKDPADDPGSGGKPKLFTQDEMTAKSASEKDQGRRSGQAEILKLLGFEGKTPEDVKARLDALTQAERAALSETERTTREAADTKAASDKALRDANELSLKTKKVALLVEAGRTLAQANIIEPMINLPVTASEADIKAAIETLKTTIPALFAVEKKDGDDDGDGKPDIDPATGKPKVVDSAPKPKPTGAPKPKTDDEIKSAAKEMLYSRHPHLKPKT